ncbi:MAG: hypothetical protein GY845_31685 [Planctomycetes bacterium]|nr:hypothetical protein [Planctomycetota bacterium]
MAFEPGGYSDKLGNRHEGRWVVKQMLRLLHEEVCSVTLEPIGDDEQGVDLVVEFNDGTRQYQQCKARNASKECWTLADLYNRDILPKMKFQLDRNPALEFALVTGVPASVFGDICESARKSNENPEDFYRFQIQQIGQTRSTVYESFCHRLDLDESQEADRAQAYDYLRRTHIVLWPDDQNSYDELLGWASMLVHGEPQTVVSCLADYAQSKLRTRLLPNVIWTHLNELGYAPRQLVHDNRLVPALQKLQQRFEDSIFSGLIGNELIAREETQELHKALNENSVVILHGAAGYGKSGILYELTKILKEEEKPYLPIRLDRQVPRNTARDFGNDMDLPESPVVCLESLLGETSGVLILDQLDALRWTSSHSGDALGICKDIVHEVRSLRSMGKHISVALSCRTFDLEYDPEIKSWLGNQNQLGGPCRKIEVKGLSDEALQKVVQEAGGNFSELTVRQKQILKSPQHLAMWVTITRQGYTSNFQSSTQLMREFWKNRYQELAKAGLNGAQIDEVLDILVSYMEKNGRISAPKSLISHRQEVSNELHTLGVIRTDSNQITFCHQSYLDFRIAECLLREINQGEGSVKNWLGAKDKQSLFRREQLRQVLSLLSDESPTKFLNNAKTLLSNTCIRFHLKHLTLEVIGQIEEPSQQLCDYMLELLADDYWSAHVTETVFLGHPQYVSSLIDKRLVLDALENEDEERKKSMLWLLRSVAKEIPDTIVDILSPYVAKGGEWPQKVLNSLPWNCRDDPEAIFALRLKLARIGVVREFVYWKELAKTHPMRPIRLIEAVISTWDTPSLKDNSLSSRGRQSRLEQWGGEELQALKAVAAEHPIDTWDLLMPHVERLTTIKSDEYDISLKDWLYGDRVRLDGRASISRGIVELLSESGRAMTSGKTSAFLLRANKLSLSPSPVVQEILIASYATVPARFADEAVKYLLADNKRFALGAGYSEPKWAPAVRLLETQSPHCSGILFRELEKAINDYHAPEERMLAEHYLPGWKEDYFGEYWGRAQYFLLPALYENRRSKNTNNLIRVLERKFGDYPEAYFLRGGLGTGGCVGSPLPPDRLHEISDRAWLSIINNKDIPEDRSLNWKQIGPDRVAESSIIHFANDLGAIAKRYPERFAQLALQFPPDVNSRYLAAILDGVKTTKPENIPEQEKASWKPVAVETVEAILDKYGAGDSQSVADNFCRLIRERAHENWSDNAIDRLLGYAISHPDLELGKLNVRCDKTSEEATIDDLVQNAINCVRGAAALAIGALLWEHSDWLERLKPGLEHLANDSHPAVRVAALQACMPLLNIDKDLAVSFFLHACKDDLRVAACRYAVYFFNSCMQSHKEKLSPVLVQMFNSDIDEIATEGATEVCARWLFHGLFKDELNKCRNGSSAHRKGIAQVASHFITKDDYTEKCKDLLLPLFDDTDADVRQKVRHTFHNKVELLKLPGIQPFIQSFIRSQSFRDDPTGILYSFEKFPEPVAPFADSIFVICEEFTGPLAELSRDISQGIAHDSSQVVSLLLRLYDQAKEHYPTIAAKCLDAWDILFENRIGQARDITKTIDQ